MPGRRPGCILLAALPERHRRDFCATASIALSSDCGRLPRVDSEMRSMQGEKVGLLLMGQACVSVNSRMGEQSDKRPWCDRSKDGLRHPQLQTPHDVMRRMTVTAATCSSRSLLPCNIRVRAVGVAQPEQSPALWIDSAGVAIRDIAGMLIAMYARNNVPHFAWLHVHATTQ